MWQILSRPWQVCIEQAWEAYCLDSTPVGAVVADGRGRILAIGRNRIYETKADSENHLHGMPLAHAEINALLGLDYVDLDVSSTTLYTSSEPCPLCVGAICMAGIGELHYASREPWTGSVNLLGATPFMRKKNIRVVGPEEPMLERFIHTLLVEYKMRIRDAGYQTVLNEWKTAFPQAFSDGMRIYKSGELDLLKERGATAKDLLDRLGELIDES